MLNLLHPKHKVTIDPTSVIFTVFFLLGLYGLYYIRSVVTLVFLGFLMMVALNPLVSVLHTKLRIPRVIGALFSYLLAFGIIALMVGVIVPPLSSELYQLLKNVSVPPQIQAELNNFKFDASSVGEIVDRVGNSVGVLFSIVTSTFSSILTVFTVIVISFYLMMDRYNLHKKVGWFTSDAEHVKLAKNFIDSLESQLGGWVRAQLVLMIVIGLITYIGLTLLGIPYALPLAVLAGLLEIVPNIGPTVASLPAIALAYLTLGPVMTGVTALFYVVVQQLENNLIVPKLMRDNANVNPLIAIIVIIIGLKVGGVIGALLAVPVYIVSRTVYSFWLKDAGKKPLD